jgi:hypothetical protein
LAHSRPGSWQVEFLKSVAGGEGDGDDDDEKQAVTEAQVCRGVRCWVE